MSPDPFLTAQHTAEAVPMLAVAVIATPLAVWFVAIDLLARKHARDDRKVREAQRLSERAARWAVRNEALNTGRLDWGNVDFDGLRSTRERRCS